MTEEDQGSGGTQKHEGHSSQEKEVLEGSGLQDLHLEAILHSV